MDIFRKEKVRAILDRLEKLEQQQTDMMTKLQGNHTEMMTALRLKLADAESRRRSLYTQQVDTLSPLLMEVNMQEVEAAVQAASFAEQESAEALQEARKVAEEARLAAGGIPKSVREATREGDVGYGADSEYIVKRVSVNLDDVERAVMTSPLVSVCRAFGRPDSKYGHEVYCAVVPRRNVRVSEPMLVIHTQKHLPTAMVPKRFFFLEDMPPGITRKALADTQMDVSSNPQVPAIKN